MTPEQQIEILRKAGFFQNGDDAVSLIAAFESLQGEIDSLNEKIQALRAVAYYDGQKFPWEHPELIAVGEERKDYLEFIDPDDLDDEEYAEMYGDDEAPIKEGSD
jgi:hypothetical protein